MKIDQVEMLRRESLLWATMTHTEAGPRCAEILSEAADTIEGFVMGPDRILEMLKRRIERLRAQRQRFEKDGLDDIVISIDHDLTLLASVFEEILLILALAAKP